VPPFSKKLLKQAHEHSYKNREELLKSDKCACFHCFQIYPAKEIKDYVDENDGEKTALCPYCLCDTIIGDASGFNLTDDLINGLAFEYLRRLSRDDMKDFHGTKIVILD
jgi:hypothetical protein